MLRGRLGRGPPPQYPQVDAPLPSVIPALGGQQACYAVGWDGDEVRSVELTLTEACPDHQLCTLPSSTASCKVRDVLSLFCNTSQLWLAALIGTSPMQGMYQFMKRYS